MYIYICIHIIYYIYITCKISMSWKEDHTSEVRIGCLKDAFFARSTDNNNVNNWVADPWAILRNHADC